MTHSTRGTAFLWRISSFLQKSGSFLLPLPANSPCNMTSGWKMCLECEQPCLQPFLSLRRSVFVRYERMPAFHGGQSGRENEAPSGPSTGDPSAVSEGAQES